MNVLPAYIGWVFIATTISTVGFIYFAVFAADEYKTKKNAIVALSIIALWMMVTGLLSYQGFFKEFEALPPRLLLAVLPPNLCIIILLLVKKSREFLMNIPITMITYIHIVRVPVEMVLWWLGLRQVVPLMLTFEGINHDILSGITAPFVAIFLVGNKRNHKIGAILWNLVALALLFNIVGHAILSAPTPFQQFNFDQPMIAVFYLPFIWLPAVVVPAVFFSHLVSLIQLFNWKKQY